MKDDEKCKECGKPIRNMRFYRDKNQDEIICYDCAVLPMQPKDNKKTTCDLSICPPEDCIEDCPHHPRQTKKEKCKRCDGVGFQFRYNNPHDSFECPKCNGSGKIVNKSKDKQITELEEKLKIAEDQIQEDDFTICRLCKIINPQHKDCTQCDERDSLLEALSKLKD